ncbi:hypothetical protein SAY86_005230 [Trapa natans]|uniref:BZIP domain-containing protein n=1 Tax=Trapa natans TaxID=22666 RepID=A0AAN7L8S5_TRANT|nr:hypothetical protein SAY86_005230 [Trapa natans]
MGVPESDQMAPQSKEEAEDEEDHDLRVEPELLPAKAVPFSSLGRQSSIYSLTLDEFQHGLCENGKNFGSMNMDEFLSSIWTAEENQAINGGGRGECCNEGNDVRQCRHSGDHVSSNNKGTNIAKQHSISRQGSLSLPETLCRKTVDEVWSEMHKSHHDNHKASTKVICDPESAAGRQPTFGEMTLEGFLIKAGVVLEQCGPATAQSQQQQQQHYGVYQSNNSAAIGTNFIPQPIMAADCLGSGPSSTYQAMPHGGCSGGILGETPGFGNGKRNSSYRPVAPPACYAPNVVNGSATGGNGYGPTHPMGMSGPVSPISSDGMGIGSVDGAGLDIAGMRARTRVMDAGPVDKVMERRQGRMIKNRESAARSRARKQAYTVELEAELNQLKEENAHLKQALAGLERKRKQQHFQDQMVNAQSRANRTRKRLRMLQRNLSCPI